MSQRDHVDGGMNEGRMGRGRYGTGLAGSETYASKASPFCDGASNDRTPFACGESFRAETPAFGGQLSCDCHAVDPASNVVASARFSVPLPLSQYAQQGA